MIDIEDLDVDASRGRLKQRRHRQRAAATTTTVPTTTSAAVPSSLSSSPAPLYVLEDITSVHLEMTDKCNAACPQCARNDSGGAVNPRLPLTELSLEDTRKILPPAILKQCSSINLCGNYGDPTACADCLRIVEYFKTTNPALRITIHSNGGARTSGFWRKLAAALSRGSGKCKVVFALDGLEDTLHLYRQNVKFKTVLRNAEAFISAGGRARWKFIVFRHNEHQVETARAMSEAMGFRDFQAVKTKRFFSSSRGKPKESTPVKDTTGAVVRHLKPPLNPAWQNTQVFEHARRIVAKHGTFDNYLDSSCVQCKAKKRGEIYVSSEGYVFPCCWLGGHLYNDFANGDADRQALHLLEKTGGLAQLDAKRRPLRDILESPFYRQLPVLMAKASVAAGKFRTCARVCGNEFKSFEGQSAFHAHKGKKKRKTSGQRTTKTTPAAEEMMTRSCPGLRLLIVASCIVAAGAAAAAAALFVW